MIQSNLVRTTISKIEGRIQLAEQGKKTILDIKNQLEKKYKEHEITYDQYVWELEQPIDGRTLSEWIHYYDSYISYCNYEIRKHKKTIFHNQILKVFASLFFILTLSLSAFYLGPTMVGLIIQDDITHDDIALENITLPEENITLPEENITLPEENITLPEENITLPEENITLPEENITLPEENITLPEENITLPEENITLPEENITLPEENITSVIEGVTITTTQLPAVLGQPVQWIKQITLDEAKKINVELPRSATKVLVKKIKEDKEAKFTITGGVISDMDTDNFIIQFFNNLLNFFKRIFSTITGRAVQDIEDEINQSIEIDDTATEYELTYETPAPYSTEEIIEKGKKVKLSGPKNIIYEDVLTFTELDENLNVKNPSSVKIYWVEEDKFIPVQKVEDKNNNGIYDYVEWISPISDNQTFEIIIEITKAEHLDENREFVSDIYDEVYRLDDIWSETISDSEYVRVTFEIPLDSSRDITIYPRTISGNPRIEVYEINGTELIAEFTSLNDDEYNKVYLTNLVGEQDTFDLRVLDGSVKFDHIIDPVIQLFYEDWESGTFGNWNNAGFTMETSGPVDPIKGTNAAGCLSEVACDMNTIVSLDTSSANAVNVSFLLQDDDMEPADCNYYWNSSVSGWVLVTSCDGSTLCGADDVWCYREDYSIDSQYLHSGFAIRFETGPDKGENVWLENINVSVEAANTPPTISGLPNVNADEDFGTNNSVMDLWDYSSDTEDANEALTYEIDSQSNTSVVDCGIFNSHYINCTSQANVSGYNDVNVSVTDTDLAKAYDVFRFTVNPINDPPWVTGLSDPANLTHNSGANPDVISSTDVENNFGDVEENQSPAIVAILSESNPEIVTCTLDGHALDCTTQTGQNGTSTVVLNYTDSGGLSVTDSIDVNVSQDTTSPQFSTYWDDNATLEGSGTGYFNITVENTNGTVLLEIDGENITATNLISNIYNASHYFSSGGTYPYKWHSWGNGTAEVYNVSEERNYVVNATPPTVIAITATPQKALNGTTINITANVTDASNISFVQAMLYYPNETNYQNLTMSNGGSGDIYWNDTYTVNFYPSGTYNVTIWANDTYGNINNTEKTWFAPYLTLSDYKEISVDGDLTDWQDVENVSDVMGDAGTNDFDINLIKLANNVTDLFAFIQVNGTLDYSDSTKYYRLFISKNDSSGNATTPSTSTALPFNYDFRIEVKNESDCKVYNNSDGGGNGTTTSKTKDISYQNNPDIVMKKIIAPDTILGQANTINVTINVTNGNGTAGLGNWGVNVSLWDVTTNILDISDWTYTNISINGQFLRAIVIADLDGDGDNDIALASGSYLDMFENNAHSLNISDVVDWPRTTTGTLTLNRISAGDLDGDGDNDLIMDTNNIAREVYIIENKGISLNISDTNAWSPTYRDVASSVQMTSSIAVGDIDGDGDLDFITGGENKVIYLWENLNNSVNISDPNKWQYTNRTLLNVPRSIKVGDLDGDGDLDIIVGDSGGYVSILKNNATNNLNLTNTSAWTETKRSSVIRWSLAVGDIDGDGDLDIATGEDTTVHILENNDPTGSLDISDTNAWPDTEATAGATAIYEVQIGDMDSDGDNDIVSVSYDNQIYIWDNKGTGSLNISDTNAWSHTNASLLSTGSAVSLGDLNNDGDLDIAVGGWNYIFSLWDNSDVAATFITSDIKSFTNATGEEQTYSLNWTPTATGSYNLTAIADNNGNYSEVLENNNRIVLEVTINGSGSALVANCSIANSTSAMEIAAKLSDLNIINGDNINVTFETGSSSASYDFAPDYRSFLSYDIEAAAADPYVPIFSDYWDDNATLTDEGTGHFNVTLENTNGTVLLEINGENITATNQSFNIYNASYTFSSGGTYPYKWHSWGSGVLENYNVSEERNYVVNATEPFKFKITTTGSPQTFSFQTDNALNLFVDWGDGNNNTYNGTGLRSHQFATAGDYNISLTGYVNRVSFYEGTEDLLNDILTPMSNSLTGINSSYQMFYSASGITTFTAEDWFDDVSGGVTNMDWMFSVALNFNQSLNNWNISSVTGMYYMFYSASAFNGNISNWNTSSVIDMAGMFESASAFNGNISNWNTSSVIDMANMFGSASAFNGNISNWNTSSVTDMNGMFYSAISFNQLLNNWDTSSVTDMNGMFYSAISFNQPLNNWDTSNVNDMQYMFYNASAFNQNISSWNVSSVTTMENMFDGVTLSTANYDSLLIGWAGLTPNLQSAVPFHGGSSKYSSDATSARNTTLIGVHSWTITDGGLEEGENTAPQIISIEINSSYNPLEGNIRNITFNFTANDTEGATDLNPATAQARFQKDGETTRLNTSCVELNASGNEANYSCTIGMLYFDDAGNWTINVTIEDDSGESAENSSTNFTYNLLTAMVMSPTALEWGTINLTDTDIPSTSHPIVINNTGNDESLNISVEGYDLQGDETTTDYIYAHNFTVDNATDGCSGNTMSNATNVTILSAILERGNNTLNFANATSGQEQLYFCLKGVPSDISTQDYSSGALVWTIRIFLVLLIPTKRKKKGLIRLDEDIIQSVSSILNTIRKKHDLGKLEVVELLVKWVKGRKDYEGDKLAEAICLILENTMEENGLSNVEILTLLVEEIRKKYGISRKVVRNIEGIKAVSIPITIFSEKIGGLEAITKYMRENLKMSYSEIGLELKRDQRTIWSSYNRAIAKNDEFLEVSTEDIYIPITIFENRNLTILESLVFYLHEKNMKYSEIGKILNRDQRNIWTISSRATGKINIK